MQAVKGGGWLRSNGDTHWNMYCNVHNIIIIITFQPISSIYRVYAFMDCIYIIIQCAWLLANSSIALCTLLAIFVILQINFCIIKNCVKMFYGLFRYAHAFLIWEFLFCIFVCVCVLIPPSFPTIKLWMIHNHNKKKYESSKWKNFSYKLHMHIYTTYRTYYRST